MAQAGRSAAQQEAQVQARLAAQAIEEHRRWVQLLANSRAGMCMASGWQAQVVPLDADLALDEPLLQRILLAAPRGPELHAAPPPRKPQPSPVPGPWPLQSVLSAPPAAVPLRSGDRLEQELSQAALGSGNILGNTSGALEALAQGVNERRSARLLAEGVSAIREGSRKVVKVAPGVELYNSAKPKQPPRVRLRVRQLPITEVRAMVPATGGPVTQWRVNRAGTQATLKVQGMTAQQMRNTAILAAEQRAPAMLRLASGRLGTGILTFAPTLLLDAVEAVGTDLQTGARTFDMQMFLLAEARNQSANVAGLAGGMLVTGAVFVFGGAAAAASAPVLVLALGVGVVAQAIWSWSGAGDRAEGWMRQALQ
jgi:hypothetical protein